MLGLWCVIKKEKLQTPGYALQTIGGLIAVWQMIPNRSNPHVQTE